MGSPDQKRLSALLDQIDDADIAYHEARAKEMKARKAYQAAERKAADASNRCDELHRQYRQLREGERADDGAQEGGV